MAKKKSAEETKPADDKTTETKPADDKATETKPADDKMVKVRCITDTRPWTHEKALEEGEIAYVPEEVAGAMLQKKQVERVR